MSRCTCCNTILTPYELTMRNIRDNSFTDLCGKCLHILSEDIITIDREDLREEVGTEIADYIEDYIDDIRGTTSDDN